MKKFKNAGFTLFELLAVLAIMAIIAGIAVPRVMQTIENARIQALESEMSMVANAVQRYAVEQELTDCIGGMFIINPNDAQTTAAGNAAAVAGVGATIDYSSAPSYSLAGLATAVDPNIDFCVIENLDGPHAVLLEEYVEGGIPMYIRVTVTALTNGEGQVEVTYGDVDADWTATDATDLVLRSNLVAGDLTPSTITRTFELEFGGTGHNHETPGN